MRVKHLLVSRVAVKWRHGETGMSWEDWVRNSFMLYDKYCRPSIKKQIDQDFTLLSLVDESISDFGNKLQNEEIVFTSGDDIRKTIIDGINGYVGNIVNDYDYVIITRVDRDDCLKSDFVSEVKKHLISFNGEERFVDLYRSFTYDVKHQVMYDSPKYYNMVSPFVSTIEKIDNGKIKCVSFAVDHTHVGQHLKGVKLKSLLAVQIIHEYNLKNKVMGNLINYNLSEFI